MPDPFVRVVVVHHRGPELTARCLRHLAAVDWPADRLEIVLVDNGSTDDLAPLLAATPGARLERSPTNLGFAGGANLGIGDLRGVDLVALVNNDAYVEPGWLRALAAAFASHPDLGGATPLVLFDERYLEVRLDSATSPRTLVDRRLVGVTVHGAHLDGDDVWDRCRKAAGFWGPEQVRGRWIDRTQGAARLLLPAPVRGGAHTIELLLSAPTGRGVQLDDGGASTAQAELAPTPSWVTLETGSTPINVVNNAGTRLSQDLYGSDIGIHERANQDWQDGDVPVWSGTAPLLAADMLRQVGPLDRRLFAYYEDVDHALRARRQGWRHRLVSGAVVRHTHAATSTQGSPTFTYLNERNRLLVMRRGRGRRAALAAVIRHLRASAGYARRDVLAALAEGRRPALAPLGARLRAVAGYVVAVLRGWGRSYPHR